ncbi:MAG: hypothetical protein Q8P59_11415, partial [Dehalococcoidia bacterium]|nr:hypothetical protein [Dehalococcoidia bacterium]
LWQSIRLSFPDPASLGDSHPPGHIPDPQPTHEDSSQAAPTPTPTPTPPPTPTPTPTRSPTPTPTATPTPTPRPVIDLHMPRRAYLPLVNIGNAK